MSTSTSTTSSVSNTALIAAFSAFPMLVGMMFAGKLAPLNAKIQAGETAAEGEVTTLVTELQTEISSVEATNPLIAPGLQAARQALAAAGFTAIPSETAICEATKAASSAFFTRLMQG